MTKQHVATVTNDSGRSFNVALVRKGDRYGLDDCLTHEKDDPMVEFYDATYAGTKDFGPLGQFVSRYYWSTLTGQDTYSRCDHRLGSPGIDLCGYVPEWKVTGQNVVAACAAVERALTEGK